jgi:DNA-binding transcriptional LysR family regulator
MEAGRLVRRLKLRDLHTFLTVASRGSMAKASRDLALTQPAVSKAIAEMEATVRVRLFDRTPAGVVLTRYGEVLLRHSRVLFDEVDQTQQELEFLADPASGRLRIGTTDIALYALVPEVLDHLTMKYPRMQFDVMQAARGDLLRALRERTIDLYLGRIDPTTEADLDKNILFPDPIMVVAGRHHPLARRRSLALADLVDQRWVMPDHSRAIVWPLFADAFARRRLSLPKAVVTCASLPLQVSMVATGRFLTFLPSSIVRSARNRLPIKPLSIDLDIDSPPMGIATLKHRSPNPVTKLFVEAVRAATK